MRHSFVTKTFGWILVAVALLAAYHSITDGTQHFGDRLLNTLSALTIAGLIGTALIYARRLPAWEACARLGKQIQELESETAPAGLNLRELRKTTLDEARLRQSLADGYVTNGHWSTAVETAEVGLQSIADYRKAEEETRADPRKL